MSTIDERKTQLCEKLLDVFQTLSLTPVLPYFKNHEVNIRTSAGKELLRITKDSIATPVPESSDSIFNTPISVADSFVPMDAFAKFIEALSTQGPVRGLDHVGFCYTVASQAGELARIKKAVQPSVFHLYEMTSTDMAKWYFIGDRTNYMDPMIELLPVVSGDYPDLPYWMPHVQIDMETGFTDAEICRVIQEYFGDSRKPILQRDPRAGVYGVRIRLGSVRGVNVMLDIGTKIVDLQWVRANMLVELQ